MNHKIIIVIALILLLSAVKLFNLYESGFFDSEQREREELQEFKEEQYKKIEQLNEELQKYQKSE